MKTSFALKDSKIMLAGPEGQLEALTTWPDAEKPKAVAIICHPNPLYQGTMNNKVVTILAKTMHKLGLATVRFNYRGVGASAGSYGDEVGEIDDLLAVKAWVSEQLPGVTLWLAGFSFGSFISASVANQTDDVKQLISVAPAISHHNFNSLNNIHCPWLVVAGEQDELVPFAEIQAFAAKPPSALTLVSVPLATHFFHGQLLNLEQVIVQYLSNQ